MKQKAYRLWNAVVNLAARNSGNVLMWVALVLVVLGVIGFFALIQALLVMLAWNIGLVWIASLFGASLPYIGLWQAFGVLLVIWVLSIIFRTSVTVEKK